MLERENRECTGQATDGGIFLYQRQLAASAAGKLAQRLGQMLCSNNFPDAVE